MEAKGRWGESRRAKVVPPAANANPRASNSTEQPLRGGRRPRAQRSEHGGGGPKTAGSVLIHEDKSVLVAGEGLTSRLERYNRLTGQSRAYFDWLAATGIDEKRATKGQGCASQLIFRKYFTLPEQPSKLSGGIFCQQAHHCTFCGAARAVRALGVAVPKVLGRFLEQPQLRPAMLTLTCRDRDDLAAMIEELLGAFGTWLQRRRNRAKGRGVNTALSLLDGGILSCETKRGSGSGQWHFHAHAVVLAPPGLTKGDFYPEWSELLGYTANLDFRYLRSAALMDEKRPFQEIDQMISEELMEVFKYALKTTELAFEDRYHAANVLHRRRLVRAFGSMHGFEPPDSLTDDLTEFEGLPYLETVFRYFNGAYQEGAYHAYPKQLDTSTSDASGARESRLPAEAQGTFGDTGEDERRLRDERMRWFMAGVSGSPG